MRPHPARFRAKINRLIANREWNAREVEHREHQITEARKAKGWIHYNHYRERMNRARPARKQAINRYLSIHQQIMEEGQKRTRGWRGLLRWIFTPATTKARWARRKTTALIPEPIKK